MDKVNMAWSVASKAHLNQSYDIFPYVYHIEMVYNVAMNYNLDESTVIACILHDTIEDSNLSYNDIKKFFGEEVAEIVFAVSDELGKTRKEKKEKTIRKLKKNEKAIQVKLCDRIANVEHSRQFSPDKFEMYSKEYHSFRKELYSHQHNKETLTLWNTLDKILHYDIKYMLTDTVKDIGKTKIYQIKALKSFGNVKEGDIGGWIESEKNLSQEGDCWVYDDAFVIDNAKVHGNAKVSGNARILNDAEVYQNAEVFGNAFVRNYSIILGNADVSGNANIINSAQISGNATVEDESLIGGNAIITDSAYVHGKSVVYNSVMIGGDRNIFNSVVCED